MYVIDASVFLNAFIPTEVGSGESREFLKLLADSGIPVFAPTLLLPEIAAAIGGGQNDPDLAEQFVDRICRLNHLTLVPLDMQLAKTASSIAAQHRLRGSDSVYAAVASRYGCPLVTLDREQLQRAAAVVQTQAPSSTV